MCAILLDFMAYISSVIGRQFHMNESAMDVSVIRTRDRTKLHWASNFVDNSAVDNLPLLELIVMQVYVQSRVICTSACVRTFIPDYVPHDSDICLPF